MKLKKIIGLFPDKFFIGYYTGIIVTLIVTIIVALVNKN